jgi:hypothetical protein
VLALFLEIYQQIWKVENEDVKILDINKNLQKHYESFYFLCLTRFLIYRSAGKKALQGNTIPDTRFTKVKGQDPDPAAERPKSGIRIRTKLFLIHNTV